MLENFERDEHVVLRLDDQRGDSNAAEELARRLRFVIMPGPAKTERWASEPVVKLPKRASRLGFCGRKTAGCGHALPHPPEKAPLIYAIGALGQAPGTGCEIYGRGNRADARDQWQRFLAQFA